MEIVQSISNITSYNSMKTLYLGPASQTQQHGLINSLTDCRITRTKRCPSISNFFLAVHPPYLQLEQIFNREGRRRAMLKKEIERKFLVAQTPQVLSNFERLTLNQGYLALDPNGTEVRLRSIQSSRGYSYFLTAKAGMDMMVRDEPEREINSDFFHLFWPLTSGRRIFKQRYELPLPGGHVAELDKFLGDLAGRELVEVEFATVPAAEAFQPPEWFGLEVTEDKRYKNQQLAVQGWPS